MSIIQDLYNIFDKERDRYNAKRSSRNAVLRELAENLAFLREGLDENLGDSRIIGGLENSQFIRANDDNAFDFNSLQKKTLSKNTYGGVKEFERYKNWSTDRLIKKAYERLATLRKLNVNAPDIDAHSRLQNLFKLLMVIIAHIDEVDLTIESTGRGKPRR